MFVSGKEDLIPIHAQVGNDPDVAIGRQELVCEVHPHGAICTARETHVRNGGHPFAVRITHLQVRRNHLQMRVGLKRARSIRVRPEDPAREEEHKQVAVRRRAKVERQRMQIRETQDGVATKVAGISAILCSY